MFIGRRYSFWNMLRWTKWGIIVPAAWSGLCVGLYIFFELHFLVLPWQPISLMGTAVAFYLGFKNNSAYERVWEARKIWGGIVNASRSFTVMARDFITAELVDDAAATPASLAQMTRSLVHRHAAWLQVLARELRKPKTWEHMGADSQALRKVLDVNYQEEEVVGLLHAYLEADEADYILTRGNRSSHLLSAQSKALMKLRSGRFIDHFRHLEMQKLITEFYTLQGKSERIKNFPLPRQYATVTLFFVVLFIALLPLAMIDIFASSATPEGALLWAAVPCATLCAWVFWLMEKVGDSSENPFEGLHNDVPILSLARGIEIDIREMIDDENIPAPVGPRSSFDLMV